MMYDTILHPTDGSDGARRATDHAIRLAAEHDATLHLLEVVDTYRFAEPALSTVELVTDAAEEQAHEDLSEAERRATDAGVAVETRVVHGHPAEEIVDYAGEVGADTVVLGTAGTGGAGGLGSVARRVVRRAPCSAITV